MDLILTAIHQHFMSCIGKSHQNGQGISDALFIFPIKYEVMVMKPFYFEIKLRILIDEPPA